MVQKKRIYLLLAACLLAFIGIGGSGPLLDTALRPVIIIPMSGTQDNHNQPVKIKFGMWETKMDILFWTSKVREYSKIRPNVTVEVETIPDNSGQYLKVRLAANDLPDVFYLKASHLPVYRDALLPLNGLKAAQANRFPAVFDGDILGLPLVSFSEYVFYHPSIFQELNLQVPQTLDEFVQVLETIKNHDTYIPIAIGGKEDWTFYPFIEFGPPLLSRDPDYLTHLSNTSQPFGQNSPFETAARLLKTIAEHRLAGSETLSIGFDEAKQLFQTHKAAMIALGQWYYQDYITSVKTDDDLDAFALPWRSDSHERLEAVTMPDQYMAINRSSKNVDEVKAFLEWIFSSGVYQDYINYSGNTSTMVNIPSDQPFFNRVSSRHPFDPFMYYGMNERYEMVKNKAQFNEKKAAQDIFAGASVEEIQRTLNLNWSKVVDQIK